MFSSSFTHVFFSFLPDSRVGFNFEELLGRFGNAQIKDEEEFAREKEITDVDDSISNIAYEFPIRE